MKKLKRFGALKSEEVKIPENVLQRFSSQLNAPRMPFEDLGMKQKIGLANLIGSFEAARNRRIGEDGSNGF